MSEQNLGRLLNRLDRLQKDRYSLKKMQEYYGREKGLAKSERKFKEYRDKEEFRILRLAELDKEILSVQGEIQKAEWTFKEEQYGKDRTFFYRECIEHLTSLKESLEEKSISDALEYLNHIEGLCQQSTFMRKEDVTHITNYFPFQSVAIRLGNINEQMAEEVKINAISGHAVGAQKRANITLWVEQLIGQIDTLIKGLKMRIDGPKK